MSASSSLIRSRFVILGIALAALLCAGSVRAQVEAGTIAGVVRDASGAVVPGAQVVITSVDTQAARSTETGASGDFSVPFLTPGRYNIEASKTGFAGYVQHDVALDVAQTLRLDVTLKLGSVQQQVVVTGAGAVLQTEDATLGQVIDRRQVQDLPLNGRNFLDLASLGAGVASHEPGARDSSAGGFSSNGGRSYDNNVMLDGIDNNNLSPDLRNGSDFIVKPPPDAISEFKVETNGYGPEFGRG